MRAASVDKLRGLQHNPDNIRNICILAHVDHGKTTLADSLVASNGIISQRMAGKLRYMDSREDEQLRGITMKSSAISLHYQQEQNDFLINLIDSPGHIDFTSEVSTAVRLCDGAVVLVDCVEGVCPQTQMVLRQAWTEGIKPVLVLNKLDKLITELKMTPLEAHLHLQRILEHVNSVTAELFTTEVVQKSTKSEMSVNGGSGVFDWSDGLEESDDSALYFSPDQGNVVFASSLFGWGFGIEDFADLYSKKLGISSSVLRKTLWGDFYLDTKNKRIRRGALSKGKNPLFVAFILENIWNVYDAVLIRRDKERMDKITKSLKLTLLARDMRSNDPNVHIRTICSQWLPLAKAVLDMIVKQLPSPSNMASDRAEKLLCGPGRKFQSLPAKTQSLKSDFLACKCDDGSPVIVFVSKMVAVERKCLPQNKQRPLTVEDIASRREIVRLKHAQMREEVEKKTEGSNVVSTQRPQEKSEEEKEEDDHVFIAFARIFSGCVKKGQKLFVLGPKHDPEKAALESQESWKHIKEVEVQDVYLFMGRELEPLNDDVPAGNIIGLAGLEKLILKSATLSSSVDCPAFTQQYFQSLPIVRVALEPKHPGDMKALACGLGLLHQADPCVQVLVQSTGEHVIITAGEIHLNKCIEDLELRFAKVKVNVSAPIVPFRETIIQPPKTDVCNEVISDQNQCVHLRGDRVEDSAASSGEEEEEEEEAEVVAPGLVNVRTANGKCKLRLQALPLPEEVTEMLVKNADLLKLLSKSWSDVGRTFEINDQSLTAVIELKKRMTDTFAQTKNPAWGEDFVERIWSFGPNRHGPNILVNRSEDLDLPSVWSGLMNRKERTARSSLANSVVSGFQIVTQSGPLCEEPLMGVAFVLENFVQLEDQKSDVDQLTEKMADLGASDSRGQLSGQVMSSVKSGCRKAFQSQPQRLMAAMYSCHIQATADVLGKMYAVLGKRGGRVLEEDLIEGSSVFDITALLPVIESFGAVEELRKRTSGLANPQMEFSHWEVIDMDPFWVPTTEEEYAHFGEKADSENVARKYMNVVRRRKGLWVKEQIVECAEKQRTLTRNK